MCAPGSLSVWWVSARYEYELDSTMHRYTRSGGKQSGTEFHSGTLGEGMLAAIADIEGGYRMMIEGWRR
jgi:hypothetical protein